MTSLVSTLTSRFAIPCLLALAAAGAGLSLGCSSSGTPTPSTTTPTTETTQSDDPCTAIDLAPPAAGAGQQFQIEMDLAAGQEREVCQLVKLKEDIAMNWSDGVMTTGSHHALIQMTNYNGTIPTTALDGQKIDGTQIQTCDTPSALWSVGSVIAGARSGAEAATPLTHGVLPPNVAFKMKQNDYVLLNFHMLNATANPIKACYKANLNGVPASQVTAEAGTMFWYNAFPTVPANGTSTARMACPITQDIQLASSVSHAHRRLVNYVATLLSGDPTSGGVPVSSDLVPNGVLFQGTEWDNPDSKVYGGYDSLKPITIKAGQWIDYHCDYMNPEDRNVAQGFDTTDEMCMFIGTYWPRVPAIDSCLASDEAGQAEGSWGGRVFGNGTKTGAQFLSCLNSSPKVFTGGGPSTSAARYATLSCLTDTCAKASANVAPLMDCLSRNSGTGSSACSTEINAVENATCD